MRSLLTFLFCLFISFSAFAEGPDAQTDSEFKYLRDNPKAIHDLRELKNCTITYYNIGVYAVIGGSIIELIDGDKETLGKFNMIANKSNANHMKLQKKLNDLISQLKAEQYHPIEMQMVLTDAQNKMLNIITRMIQDVMLDPSKAKSMMTIMMGSTNKCDNEFLK